MEDLKIPNRWSFEGSDMAASFDSHVQTQLPWYAAVTGVVAGIVAHYLPTSGVMYDIGASTGNIGRAVRDTLENTESRIIAIEPSWHMHSYLQNYDDVNECLAEDALFEKYDVCVCFLTLMFVDPKRRVELLEHMRERMNVGGCIIIVDKCEPVGGYLSTVMHNITLQGKIASGTTYEAASRKELSLIGVQRPIDPAILGDDAVEFFRMGDFAGWVIEG